MRFLNKYFSLEQKRERLHLSCSHCKNEKWIHNDTCNEKPNSAYMLQLRVIGFPPFLDQIAAFVIKKQKKQNNRQKRSNTFLKLQTCSDPADQVLNNRHYAG